MESSTAHYTTSKLNKVGRIVMEEWLTNQEATPTSRREQLQRKLSNNIINLKNMPSKLSEKNAYWFAECCLRIISITRIASWVCSDSWPFKACAIALIGIFAAKDSSTLYVFWPFSCHFQVDCHCQGCHLQESWKHKNEVNIRNNYQSR